MTLVLEDFFPWDYGMDRTQCSPLIRLRCWVNERERNEEWKSLWSPWVPLWWEIFTSDLPGSARGSACCCSSSRNRPVSKPRLSWDWRTRLALPARDPDDPVRLKIKPDRVTGEPELFFPKLKPIGNTNVRVHSFKNLNQASYTSILKALSFSK